MTKLLSDIGKTLLSGMAALVLFGCDDKQEEITLANEQLADMVFVAGGSFMMGDFGPTMGEHLPFSFEQDDKPLHKVTLDSFSMSKYRVTWKQYNRYLDIQGKPKSKAHTRFKSYNESDSFSKFAGDSYPAAVL